MRCALMLKQFEIIGDLRAMRQVSNTMRRQLGGSDNLSAIAAAVDAGLPS